MQFFFRLATLGVVAILLHTGATPVLADGASAGQTEADDVVLTRLVRQTELPTLQTTLKVGRAPRGAGNDAVFLSTVFNESRDCGNGDVGLSSDSGKTDDHLWDLIPVPVGAIKKGGFETFPDRLDEKEAVYYARSVEMTNQGCELRWLSAKVDCGDTWVGLSAEPDDRGAQWWIVVPQVDGSYKFKNFQQVRECELHQVTLAVDKEWAQRWNDFTDQRLNFTWFLDIPAGDSGLGAACGRWVALDSCDGCGPLDFSRSYGVTATTESSWITSMQAWASVTTKQSMKVTSGPYEGEGSVSYAAGWNRTTEERMSKLFSITRTAATKRKYDKRYFYQWQQQLEYHSVGGLRVATSDSPVFLCTDEAAPKPAMEPVCK